jgi:TRAP-type C4-dicarboxylate transport system substrate-binding protein
MMNKFFVVAMTVLLVGTLILCACAGPAPAQKIELKWSFHHPAPSFVGKGMFTPWAKQIEEASGGRVKLTLYPSGSLVKMHEEYDAVESGLVDMSAFTPDITPGRFPLCEIAGLPRVFPSGEIAGRVYNELLEQYAADAELKGVKLLGVLTYPPMQLHGTKQAYTLEDFKGQKIRTEGKVESWTAEALGGVGVIMETSEIYTSVERGLVDSFFFLWEGVLAFGFENITKYRTKCDMFTRGNPIIMNWDTWNSLPADIQEVFTNNMGPEVSSRYGALFDAANAEAKGKVMEIDTKMGNPGIYNLPADEEARWSEAVSTVIDRWVTEKEAKGVPAKAMLDDAYKLIEKYSK